MERIVGSFCRPSSGKPAWDCRAPLLVSVFCCLEHSRDRVKPTPLVPYPAWALRGVGLHDVGVMVRKVETAWQWNSGPCSAQCSQLTNGIAGSAAERQHHLETDLLVVSPRVSSLLIWGGTTGLYFGAPTTGLFKYSRQKK